LSLSRRSVIRTLAGAAAAPLFITSSAGANTTRARAQGGAAPPGDSPPEGRRGEPIGRDEVAGGAPGAIPVTGRLLPTLEALDHAITPLFDSHPIAGASVAITQRGRLKVARGYGFANVQANEPMRPETNVLLASVSKVPTAQAVLKLVEQGQLSLEDRVFERFRELRPPEGRREDPRLNEITVAMCLWHTGGWNRQRTPFATPMQVRRVLRLDREPTPDDVIRYMKGVPLDFAPGTQQVYSNFGYILLGTLIARMHREGYGAFMHEFMLRPMGIALMRIDPPGPEYLPGEAHRYTPPADHPIPGGHPLMTMAAGGWVANCIDLAKFMTAIDGSRTGTPWLSPAMMQAMVSKAPGIPPKPSGAWFGLGWDDVEERGVGGVAVRSVGKSADVAGGASGDVAADVAGDDIASRFMWAKDGGVPGVSTWVQHLPSGVDFVILCNTSGEGELAQVRPKVLDFVRSVRQWPDGDLFTDFA